MPSSSSRAPWTGYRAGVTTPGEKRGHSRRDGVPADASPAPEAEPHFAGHTAGSTADDLPAETDTLMLDGKGADNGGSEPPPKTANGSGLSLPPDVAKRLALAESRANKAERLAQNNADKLMNMIERVKTMAEARKVPQRVPQGAIIAGEARADDLRMPLPKRYTRSSGIEVVPSAHMRRRRTGGALGFLWFVLIVLLPIALASVYYFRYAADQYASGMQFFVRGGEANPTDGFGKLTGFAKAGGMSTFVDAQIVSQYMRSRQIVEDLLKTLDLRQMYAREDADAYMRLKDDASLEELTAYWNSMITVTAELTSGVVTFEVRAFTREDAAAIAQGALAASEKLVNDLSRRAREDAVRSATADLDRSAKKLKAARAELRKLRDTGRILDAKGAVEANTRLVGELESSLAKLNADLNDRLAYLSPTAPTITSLRNQIASLKQEIARVKASVVAAAPEGATTLNPNEQPAPENPLGPFTSMLTNFEENYTEIQIDEFNYKNSLEYLQHARAQADQQQSYLSVIVQPTMPQMSTYPQRYRAIVIVALVSCLLWVLSMLLAHSVRDHML